VSLYLIIGSDNFAIASNVSSSLYKPIEVITVKSTPYLLMFVPKSPDQVYQVLLFDALNFSFVIRQKYVLEFNCY
jgi:hypothetical protein